jgi:Histidine kinase-, DNA gyrase B-, and HSP90-like ATPase
VSTPSDLDICLPPSAPDLLESMRAIGYSFEAAVADIIDNSIAASATKVDIRFGNENGLYVAILDDGEGMSAGELVAGMRHGSSNPNHARAPADLGRFGLGLKTASLSQCRCLTVVSLKDGALSARRWDLEHVGLTRDWTLIGLSAEAASNLPQVPELKQSGRGTLVLWQKFDRLSDSDVGVGHAIGERMDIARNHLALVFHRFLNPGKKTRPLALSINLNPVRAVDPFLSSNKATQALPEQEFAVSGEPVRVAPFILPHISKLSAADLELAGGEEGLRRNQGFYVYRNLRLISWGSWYRLVRQEELTKLARVRVDITNRLDHLWSLDIKKSTAHPPDALRNGLRQIINRITEGSRKVYTYRGRRTGASDLVRVWDRTAVRGGVTYSINRDHPMIAAVENVLPDSKLTLFHKLIQVLEGTFPFDAVYVDMASERRPEVADAVKKESDWLMELAERIVSALGAGTPEAARFLGSLVSIEPFSRHVEKTKEIVQALTHERH